MKFDYVWDKQNFRVHNEAKDQREREKLEGLFVDVW